MVSVFVGTSVDGFIARRNGEFDFLPDECEPHGYEEFIATIDAIVIGRNTFEVVRQMAEKMPEWPYGERHVVVLSNRQLDLTSVRAPHLEQMAGDPATIVAKLAVNGANNLYVDGGDTIQRFLRAGLVDRFIITRVPVLIGEGISLFGQVPHDVRLKHVETKQYASGLVQSEYRVLKAGG